MLLIKMNMQIYLSKEISRMLAVASLGILPVVQ